MIDLLNSPVNSGTGLCTQLGMKYEALSYCRRFVIERGVSGKCEGARRPEVGGSRFVCAGLAQILNAGGSSLSVTLIE